MQNPATASPTLAGAPPHLTHIDVIAEEAQGANGARTLVPSLHKEDFRILDNGHLTPVDTFGSGAQHTARPIALWLLVECNMAYPSEWRSRFMLHHTQELRPALMHLYRSDSIGVAHWCGDGEAKIDLQPGLDVDGALKAVDSIVDGRSTIEVARQDAPAMERMVKMVFAASSPQRLPVLLFLHGDHMGMLAEEANNVLTELLNHEDIVYGLNDQDFHPNILEERRGGGYGYKMIHMFAQETGGQFYSSEPKYYASAMDYILSQLHYRYTLGFEPIAPGGGRHELKVVLAPDANHQAHSPELKYRIEYTPRP